MPLPLGKDWLNVEYFDGIDIFFIDLVSKKGLIFFGHCERLKKGRVEGYEGCELERR